MNIRENKLETKDDLVQALKTILKPLKPYYSESKATLTLSKTGVGHGEKTAGMESLLRILWGMAPLYAGDREDEQFKDVVRGIVNGTNPEHNDYWGDLVDYDQKIVELASIGYTLILPPPIHFGMV